MISSTLFSTFACGSMVPDTIGGFLLFMFFIFCAIVWQTVAAGWPILAGAAVLIGTLFCVRWLKSAGKTAAAAASHDGYSQDPWPVSHSTSDGIG